MIKSLSSIIQNQNNSNSLFVKRITQSLIQLSMNVQLNQAINEISNNIITNNIQITNQIIQSNQITQLNIPQTLFENLNQMNKSSVILPAILNITKNVQSIGIGITVIQYNSMISSSNLGSSSLMVQLTKHTTSQSQIDSTVLQSNSLNQTNFQVLLPMNSNFQTNQSTNQTTYHFEECKIGKPYNITINCLSTSTKNYILNCYGNETRLYNISCPQLFRQPICQSSDTSNCQLQSYNSYQITCDCKKSYETKYATISVSEQIIVKDFIANWKQITKINAQTIQHNLVITIIIATIVLITFIGIILCYLIDKKERKEKLANIKRNSIRFSIDSFFNSLLPIEFTDQNWYTKLKSKISTEHIYICVFMKHYNRNELRLISWLRLSLKILNFLFVDTILAVS